MPAQPRPESPGSLIGGGLLMMVLAGVLFVWLSHTESTGGTLRMPVIALLLYQWLGKWGLCGAFGLIGMIPLVKGLLRVMRGD